MGKRHLFMNPGWKLIWFTVLLLLATCASSSTIPGAVADANICATETAAISNPNHDDCIDLRERPSETAKSLGKYYNGVIVTLLSDVDKSWINVRIGNLEGYMESRYISLDAVFESVPSAMPRLTIQNAAGTGLNLREFPSLSAISLALYPNGTEVQVLGLVEDWYHVQVEEQIGFMLANRFSSKISHVSAGAWEGPTGTHKIGEWTISVIDYTGIVNNTNPDDWLHLRAEPNPDAKSLGKYYNGVVVVIEGPSNGEYTRVSIGEFFGYMKTDFLSISAPISPASAMPVLTVNNPHSISNLHLREKQSTNSRSLGVYANGTEVTLMGFNDAWAHVIVDGKTGFMVGEYLE